MSILDELKAIENERRPVCRIRAALDKLNTPEQEEMEQVVMSNAFSQSVLIAFFKRRGFEISGESLSKHRRKVCRCPN